jgi:hypothetical protein
MYDQPEGAVATSARPYAISAFLIGVPVLALLAVPLYSHREPVLAGFPMFYWWTFLWIAAISAGTWASYRIIGRATASGQVHS